MKYQPLTREEVRRVIDGRGAAPRVPVLLHLWTDAADFGDRRPAVDEIMGNYPQDVQVVYWHGPGLFEPPDDDPTYRWANFARPAGFDERAIDDRAVITDWAQLDGILADFPSPEYAGIFRDAPAPDGRYRLAHWWFCLFERHWQIRGMTGALMDFHLHPAEVHRLYRAVTDFYLRMIERAADELDADGIYTTDDLGTQTGPFFSPATFDEFYRPYYAEMIDRAHRLGMHFWLHTCGNVELLLPRFIDIGLDVIHPIQKYAMDERAVAARFGGQICFWAGFDVQQIIPWGTADEVADEVRYLLDTYHRPEGRLLFSAGNAIKRDCPLDSLRTLYAMAFDYGAEVVRR